MVKKFFEQLFVFYYEHQVYIHKYTKLLLKGINLNMKSFYAPVCHVYSYETFRAIKTQQWQTAQQTMPTLVHQYCSIKILFGISSVLALCSDNQLLFLKTTKNIFHTFRVNNCHSIPSHNAIYFAKTTCFSSWWCVRRTELCLTERVSIHHPLDVWGGLSFSIAVHPQGVTAGNVRVTQKAILPSQINKRRWSYKQQTVALTDLSTQTLALFQKCNVTNRLFESDDTILF